MTLARPIAKINYELDNVGLSGIGHMLMWPVFLAS